MRRSELSRGEKVIEKKRRGKVRHGNWSLPHALTIRRQANGQGSSQRLWSEGKGIEREGKGEKMEEKEGGRLRGRMGGWEIGMEDEQKREEEGREGNEQREGTIS